MVKALRASTAWLIAGLATSLVPFLIAFGLTSALRDTFGLQTNPAFGLIILAQFALLLGLSGYSLRKAEAIAVGQSQIADSEADPPTWRWFWLGIWLPGALLPMWAFYELTWNSGPMDRRWIFVATAAGHALITMVHFPYTDHGAEPKYRGARYPIVLIHGIYAASAIVLMFLPPLDLPWRLLDLILWFPIVIGLIFAGVWANRDRIRVLRTVIANLEKPEVSPEPMVRVFR